MVDFLTSLYASRNLCENNFIKNNVNLQNKRSLLSLDLCGWICLVLTIDLHFRVTETQSDSTFTEVCYSRYFLLLEHERKRANVHRSWWVFSGFHVPLLSKSPLFVNIFLLSLYMHVATPLHLWHDRRNPKQQDPTLYKISVLTSTYGRCLLVEKRKISILDWGKVSSWGFLLQHISKMGGFCKVQLRVDFYTLDSTKEDYMVFFIPML